MRFKTREAGSYFGEEFNKNKEKFKYCRLWGVRWEEEEAIEIRRLEIHSQCCNDHPLNLSKFGEI